MVDAFSHQGLKRHTNHNCNHATNSSNTNLMTLSGIGVQLMHKNQFPLHNFVNLTTSQTCHFQMKMMRHHRHRRHHRSKVEAKARAKAKAKAKAKVTAETRLATCLAK